MNYCPNCGTEMQGRFCSNCGFDSQKEKKPTFFTRVKEWLEKAWEWIKNHKKLSTIIGSSTVVVLTLVIVLSTTLSNIFRVSKVNNIELGMSIEEVVDILGDPTETIDDGSTYCWYEKKAAKKIEKINGVFDDMDEDTNEEEIEGAIEETDGVYSELEEMTFKAIIVEFSGDKVTRVVFDKNHKYDEFDEYATAEKKAVKEAEIEAETVLATLIKIQKETCEETRLESVGKQSLQYTARFEDGSYILGTTTTKVEISDDQAEATLKWSDPFAEYSENKNLTVTGSITITEDGVLTSCSKNAVNVVIPEEVTTIDGKAFAYCERLVEIYNKSSAKITKDTVKNVYTPTSGQSKLSAKSEGYIIYTDGADKILVGYVGGDARLSLPDGITGINGYAFYGEINDSSSKVKSITIPDSVTSIGDGAFYSLDYVFCHKEIFDDYYDSITTTVVCIEYFTVAIVLLLILVIVVTIVLVKKTKKRLAMKALYHKICADSSVEITLADGMKKSVEAYLQERKGIFTEYLKKRYKKKKQKRLIIGISMVLIFFSVVFFFFWGIVNTLGISSYFMALYVLFWLFFGFIFWIVYPLCYRLRSRKEERKLYDEQLKVLECYYPSKSPFRKKKNGKIEVMLAHVGLTWDKKELKNKS